MGGGSSVMGMWALRGLPSDYDGWAQAGARGWGWSDVLPYFRRVNVLDGGDGRNSTGTPATRTLAREEWPAFARALESAAIAKGFPFQGDINDVATNGYFAMPLNHESSERAGSARCYLTTAVRRRANLRILAETRVTRLMIDGRRIAGVEVEYRGERRALSASEVIVSAGAIHSPALLLHAGIGPAAALAPLGIAPVVDRRGVGRNLQNHVFVHFALTLQPGSDVPAHARHYAVAGLRFSSNRPGCPRGDLLLCAIGRVSTRPFGRRVGMLAAALYAPYSRGNVELNPSAPETSPRVSFRLLSDPRDTARLIVAGQFAERFLLDPAVRRCYREVYLLPEDPPLRRFNDRGAIGAGKSILASSVIDGPPWLRRWAIARAIAPGRLVADSRHHLAVSPSEILAAAAPMFHPTGTCAMGPADNPDAVVDPECRVHGVAGLRVIDASIMPRIPSANTNLAVLMVAERAADLIRCRRRT